MDYNSKKNELLNDKTICKENRALFQEFFEKKEYELKRRNRLGERLDQHCEKTLIAYISKFKNVNIWFKNKPLKKITKQEIKDIYDGLEEGRIKNARGKRFEDREGYYNKVFKSKLFELAGKDKLAKEVLEYNPQSESKEVNFITEEDVKNLVNVAISLKHKALIWVAFDIGENINSLLLLRKRDCLREINETIKEPEYRINLRKEILKRSRTPRTIITNYKETSQFLDILLKDLKDDALIFDFKYSMARKFLERAIKITDCKCKPTGKTPSWKDMRSSMTCELMRNESYSEEQLKDRLGHTPGSQIIAKYANYLALNRKTPKKRFSEYKLSEIEEELKQSKLREKLQVERIEKLTEDLENLVPTIEALQRNVIEAKRKGFTERELIELVSRGTIYAETEEEFNEIMEKRYALIEAETIKNRKISDEVITKCSKKALP